MTRKIIRIMLSPFVLIFCLGGMIAFLGFLMVMMGGITAIEYQLKATSETFTEKDRKEQTKEALWMMSVPFWYPFVIARNFIRDGSFE